MLLAAGTPDEVVILIALSIVGGLAIPLTAIIMAHRRKMVRDDMEATLKMEMIQRGLSAEEIERVLGARLRAGGRKNRGRPAAHEGHPQHSGNS